jgi:hypothetical protein
MSVQLRAVQGVDEHRTMMQMAMDFISLCHSLNEVESVQEQTYIEHKLESLIANISRKFDNSVFVIRGLEAQAAYLKDMANSLLNKAKAAENAKDRLRGYLIRMGSINSNMLRGQIFKGSLYSKKSVEDVDLDRLPKEYKVEKIEIRPDKKLILKHVEEGRAVPGAVINTNIHLRIS